MNQLQVLLKYPLSLFLKKNQETFLSLVFKIVSLFVFAILYLYTAILVFIVLIFSWFGLKDPIYFISRIWAESVFLILGKKLRIKGRENIDKNKRYILIANHASLFDILAIMSFYPRVSWFGHERLLKVPLFGHLLKMTYYIPFKEPTIRNTRQMMEQLINQSENHTIAIFPEGTRTMDGKISAFFKGFIYLFRNRELEILPVTLNGFYKLKPKNRTYINFGAKLDVIIHAPVPRDELTKLSDNEIVDKVRSIIVSAYY
jgi:1-acyl-sn-glycerol-3-phosphate acyltransferase